MSSVTGLLGIGGSAQSNVTNPVTQQNITGAQTGVSNALGQQQQIATNLNQQNGIGNQSQVYNQLQGVANGTGPNPAQAQLAQATGQNVANQASLAAGQRGAAGNVGLMSRQAAQQGSAAQQNAAGQAATLQANQSLNAINSAGNIANTQAANQIGQANNVVQGQQANANAQYGAQAAYNSAQAGIASQQQAGSQGLLGGLAQGAGGVGAGLLGGQSAGALANTASGLLLAANGGQIPSMPSSGPSSMLFRGNGFAQGGDVGSKLKAGGHVPGKPVVGGAKNDYSNDTVNAKLSPGEIVIPRSVTMGKDPVKGAAAFVQATLAKKGRK
jgi:hypothetical protein